MLLVLWNLSYIQTGVRTLRKDSPVVHMVDQAELGNGHWYTDAVIAIVLPDSRNWNFVESLSVITCFVNFS